MYCFGGNTRIPRKQRFAFTNSVHVLDLCAWPGHFLQTLNTNTCGIVTASHVWSEIQLSGVRPPPIAGHTATVYGHECLLFGGWNNHPARQYFNSLCVRAATALYQPC
jgi:hypothetical protein